ncbi:uberolysin/carnocyclin family circular bacteriocin [Bacillus sp. A015]
MNQSIFRKRSLLSIGVGLLGASLIYVLFLAETPIQITAAQGVSGTAELTSTLGISTVAAKKAIDIIDSASTVLSIISLLGVVTGAGAIGYGIIVAAKAMSKKYGKKYAAFW